MRRTFSTGVIGVLAVAVLLGCAAAPAPSTATSAGPRTPTATPEPVPIDPVAVFVEERLGSMSLEQKAASLLMLHHPGTDPVPVRDFAAAHELGGLILMGDNIPPSEAELRAFADALSTDAEAPLLLAIDEEGGYVTRLPWDRLPAGIELARQPVVATGDAFAGRAEMLDAGGLAVNFGIVADVTDDPASFIYERVLGTDPAAAAERVAAAVAAEDGRVYSTLKHFPGHGSAPGDSHVSIPATERTIEEWRGSEALPFAAGIDAGAELVMFAHVAFTAVDPAPATLSPVWHTILREELGFTGVAVTDDMLMLQHNGLPEFADPVENAIRALAAGNDLLVYVLPGDPSSVDIEVGGLIGAIAEAVRDGRLSAEAVDASVGRVLTLRRLLAG